MLKEGLDSNGGPSEELTEVGRLDHCSSQVVKAVVESCSTHFCFVHLCTAVWCGINVLMTGRGGGGGAVPHCACEKMAPMYVYIYIVFLALGMHARRGVSQVDPRKKRQAF